jgi:hypothetical protein
MPQNTSRGYTYPTYGDAGNFPAQIQDLATDIDTDMDSLFDRLVSGYNMAAARVRSTGINQAVATATDVNATYTEEIYDNTGMVNLGTSNTTLTFTQTGLYIASARVSFAGNGGGPGARQIRIVTNGSLGTVARKSMLGDAVQSTILATSCLFFASAGNTILLTMRHDAGVTIQSTTRTLMVARMGALS